MLSESWFMIRCMFLFAPAFIAGAGGLIAFRLRKSPGTSQIVTIVTAATLLGMGLTFRRFDLPWSVGGVPAVLASVILLHLLAVSRPVVQVSRWLLSTSR